MTSTSRPRMEHLCGALEVVAGRADRGGHPQPAALVARRERMPPVLEEVLGR